MATMHRATRLRAYRRNVQKHRARAATRYALKTGKLIRPKECSKCGRSKMLVQAHHEDYSKPLEVTWLCHWCHHYRHEELRKAAKEQTQ
jgi:ribosomal protein S27AE